MIPEAFFKSFQLTCNGQELKLELGVKRKKKCTTHTILLKGERERLTTIISQTGQVLRVMSFFTSNFQKWTHILKLFCCQDLPRRQEDRNFQRFVTLTSFKKKARLTSQNCFTLFDPNIRVSTI